MRFVHTADWHLGHTLKDLSRAHEHDRFLAWLLDMLEAHDVDALLIAGDVFETAQPPEAARAQWFRFLGEARRRRPRLDIVVTGGNHDSASGLDAPRPLLSAFGVHVVGGLPRAGGAVDVTPMIVPLHDARGEVAAWCVAVPYIRPSDVRVAPTDADGGYARAVAEVYARAFAAARGQRTPGQAIVGMGHMHVAGTKLSDESERKILGNLSPLSASLFPDDVAYAALGHLHLAQHVGREHVRYSGSPIPLSMAEADYEHQVVLVEIEGEACARIEALRVPRTVQLIRRFVDAPRPVDEVLASLALLPPLDPATPDCERPLLDVAVLLDGPRPRLRSDVEAALVGKAARLVSIRTVYAGTRTALGDVAAPVALASLAPEAVLRRVWRARYDADVPADVLATFHELERRLHDDATTDAPQAPLRRDIDHVDHDAGDVDDDVVLVGGARGARRGRSRSAP